MSDAPKSALELVMERLRKKDAETRRRRVEADRRAEGRHRRSALRLRGSRRRAADPAPQQGAGRRRLRRSATCSTSSTGATWIGSPPIATPRSGRSASRSRNRECPPALDPPGRQSRWRLRVADAAASRDRPTDLLDSIRDEGLERSQVLAMFSMLTDQIGPRLTGTPAHKQAAEWARDRLRTFGLADAALEPWRFGRGWVLDRLVVEMVEPRYMPLIGYAEAWSPSTGGEITATPVMIGGRSTGRGPGDERRAARRDRHEPAAGASSFARTGRNRRRPTAPVRIGAPPNPGPRAQRRPTSAPSASTLHEAGAGVIVRTSAGEHGTVFVLGRDQADAAVPTIVLAGEHYNLIVRMLARGMPVKLRVNVQSHFVTDDPNSYNVVAAIPGTRPAGRRTMSCCSARISIRGTPAPARPTTPTARRRCSRRCGSSKRSAPGRSGRSASRSGAARNKGCSDRRPTSTQHLAGDAQQDGPRSSVRLPQYRSRDRSHLRVVPRRTRRA